MTKRKKVPVTSHPGVSFKAPPQSQPKHPPGLTEEQMQYRMLLQEAILYVTKQVLEEQREEVLKRAEERVAQLKELRGL